MAGTTRLELATSAVTGQRSNQLNYVPALLRTRFHAVLRSAMTSFGPNYSRAMVGSAGLEPATSCL